jgi:hypothetical protein
LLLLLSLVLLLLLLQLLLLLLLLLLPSVLVPAPLPLSKELLSPPLTLDTSSRGSSNSKNVWKIQVKSL